MRRASSGELTATLVQSCFAARDYESPEAFRNKVLELCGRMAASRSACRLVVYPELTGLWIPLLKGRRSGSLLALGAALFLRHSLGVLGGLATGGGLSVLFRSSWQASLHDWIEPFRETARRLGAYVCPGSSLLPPFDWESSRGPHVTGRGIYNTSCLISPLGTILGWTRKIHPLPVERRLGVRAGSLQDLDPYDTDLGRIGLLLCLDGFHESAVQRLDRLGCRIALQPSANPLPWLRPPRRETELSQEEQWLSQGLGYLIQGRENIGVALNPMSVASVLDHREEGRSNVFLNPAKGLELGPAPRLPEAYRGYSGLAAIASSCDQEEILSVTIRGLR